VTARNFLRLATHTLTVSLFSNSISMANAISFDCKFDSVCDPVEGCSNTELSLVFQIDSITGDAFVLGNNGLSAVQIHQGTQGVTFLERLPTGAVQSTTVTTSMPDPGKAVHSRHSVLSGELIPSQYFGRCALGTSDD
jgi:hypothetical protein